MAWKNGSDSAPMTNAIFLPAHDAAAAEPVPEAAVVVELLELPQAARRTDETPATAMTPAVRVREARMRSVVLSGGARDPRHWPDNVVRLSTPPENVVSIADDGFVSRWGDNVIDV